MTDDAVRLGPHNLKGLAHPLRLQLLAALRQDGPATATLLAQRFNESTGATSYHLRQLARHGFIEPDIAHAAGGRERWWKASAHH